LIGGILFIAGGTSNLVDRIARGNVVDFMNVGIGSLRTGIFNVADVALMVGVVLVAFRFHNKSCDVPRVPNVRH
jgi:signal peptidase II